MTIEPPPLQRPPVTVRRLGVRECAAVVCAMRRYTDRRTATSGDEIWLLEHRPVFTLGHAGKREHVLAPGAIPVLRVDRGGQVTYHAPGQLVVYLLLDLRRLGLGIRRLVSVLEQSVLEWLAEHGIAGARRRGAPGIYVHGKKVAALGLRVRHGCCYHGLAVNVDMDLAPFARIDPCGYPGLEVTQLSELGVSASPAKVGERLLRHLVRLLGYLPPAGDAERRLPGPARAGAGGHDAGGG